MSGPAPGNTGRHALPSTPTFGRARAVGDPNPTRVPRGGLESQFSHLDLDQDSSSPFPGRFQGRQLPGQPEEPSTSPSPSPTRAQNRPIRLSTDTVKNLFFERILPQMDIWELIERVPELQERFPPRRQYAVPVTVPKATHQPNELDGVTGLALVFTVAEWAYNTRDDGRDDLQNPLVHSDYWTPTQPRKDLRDIILKLVADLLRLCDRMTDTQSLLMVGIPEVAPSSDAAPLAPDDVNVRIVASRYIKNTHGTLAKGVLLDMFKNLLAVEHAAYFSNRKRANMSSQAFRELPARQVRTSSEPWRYVAAPIVATLLGGGSPPDLLQENINRATERQQHQRLHGRPRFRRVAAFFLAHPVINVDMRRHILSMFCSITADHHPAADWYYLFTTSCSLQPVTAAGLLAAAVQDATEEGWPV